MMSRGPGFAKGYYRGDTFVYRVVCMGVIKIGSAKTKPTYCTWTGYRAWPRWGATCPKCGGPTVLA